MLTILISLFYFKSEKVKRWGKIYAGFDLTFCSAIMKMFVTNLSFSNLMLVLKEEHFYWSNLSQENYLPQSLKIFISLETIRSCLNYSCLFETTCSCLNYSFLFKSICFCLKLFVLAWNYSLLFETIRSCLKLFVLVWIYSFLFELFVIV